jgi:hypothetical protein
VAEDGGLQVAYGLPGLESELLPEQVTQVLVGPQRLGVAPGAVESEHPEGPEPFPERVGPGEHLELAGDEAVVPRRHVGFDAVLKGGQAGFLQTHRLSPGERGVRHFGQRRAPPQAQGLPQHLGGLGVVTGGGQLASPGAEGLEPEGVDGVVVHPQQVARRTGPQRLPVFS